MKRKGEDIRNVDGGIDRDVRFQHLRKGLEWGMLAHENHFWAGHLTQPWMNRQSLASTLQTLKRSWSSVECDVVRLHLPPCLHCWALLCATKQVSPVKNNSWSKTWLVLTHHTFKWITLHPQFCLHVAKYRVIHTKLKYVSGRIHQVHTDTYEQEEVTNSVLLRTHDWNNMVDAYTSWFHVDHSLPSISNYIAKLTQRLSLSQ